MEWEDKQSQANLDQLRFDSIYESGGVQRNAIKRLAEAPSIATTSNFYWTAYLELCSEKPMGMSALGAIPTRAIFAYATEFGLRGAEREVLLKVVRALDIKGMMLAAAKAKKEESSKKPIHSGRPGKVVEVW